MPTLARKPAPLVPMLPDVRDRRLAHPITTLSGGDQLHCVHKLLGFPKGSVLPIYGYCALFDDDGNPYAVTAYVRPLHLEQAVAFAEREAVRFRFDNQREQWFGAVLMYLVPIDLTDYADCLRLEKAPGPLVGLLYPEAAAPLRLAA